MTGEVPNRLAIIRTREQVKPWLERDLTLPHALLVTSKPKAPLLWKVLQNDFNKKIAFGAVKDLDGAIAKSLGVSFATGKESYVLIWNLGKSEPVVYQGTLKYDPLSTHFKDILASGRDEL